MLRLVAKTALLMACLLPSQVLAATAYLTPVAANRLQAVFAAPTTTVAGLAFRSLQVEARKATIQFGDGSNSLAVALHHVGELPQPATRTAFFDVALAPSGAVDDATAAREVAALLGGLGHESMWHSPPERSAPPPVQAQAPPNTTQSAPAPRPKDNDSLWSRPLGSAIVVAALLLVGLVAAMVYFARARASIALGAAVFFVVGALIPTKRKDGQENTGALVFDTGLGWAPRGTPAVGAPPPERCGIGQRLQMPDVGRPQLVALGDSVTYGWGLPESDTFVAQLGRELSETQVINAGVSGYSPDQEMLYFERIERQLTPKLVVVFVFVGNDWMGTAGANNYGNYKPQLREQAGVLVQTNPTDGPMNCVSVLSWSVLAGPFWTAAQVPTHDDRERVTGVLSALCRSPKLDDGETRKTLTLTFARLEAAAQRNGAKLLTVLLPTAILLQNEPGNDDFSPEHWRAWRNFREILQQGGHDMLDLRDQFRAERTWCQPIGPEQVRCDDMAIFLDGGHFTAAASKRLGGWLAEFVKNQYGLR